MNDIIDVSNPPTKRTALCDRITELLSIERVPIIQGWTRPEKGIAMADLVLSEKPSLIVEIGVFGGASLLPQALALQQNGHGLIVGIDPWTKDAALEGDVGQENADWWKECDLNEIALGCWAAIDQEGLGQYAALVRSQAHLVCGFFKCGGIDILEIDGNHSELASCRDVELYLPLVRPGGHIWFDDSDWKTTQKAVATLDGACERVTQVGTCILFRKPQ